VYYVTHLHAFDSVAAAVPGVVSEQEVDRLVVGVDLGEDVAQQINVELKQSVITTFWGISNLLCLSSSSALHFFPIILFGVPPC
jgi:hypothetical protein